MLVIQSRPPGRSTWRTIDPLKEANDIAHNKGPEAGLTAAQIRLAQWHSAASDLNGYFHDWAFRLKEIKSA